jgi:hypothetical protein
VKRCIAVSIIVLVGLVPAAEAKPRMTTQTLMAVEDSPLFGYGCEPSTYWVDYRGRPRDLEGYRPVEGDLLAGPEAYLHDGPRYRLTVTHVEEGAGRITWTVAPDPADCARYGDTWEWRVPDREWSVEYSVRRLAIVASRYGGVRSIAGLRLKPVSRRTVPTVRRVIRAWNRPTSTRRGTGGWRVACHLRWKRLGLRATFVNYGGSPPCQHGFLQAVSIQGRHAKRWAVRVGWRPAVVPGTPFSYFGMTGDGARNPYYRAWMLAEMYWPIGPGSDYAPAVSATFEGRGRIRSHHALTGFEVFIGAGGD